EGEDDTVRGPDRQLRRLSPDSQGRAAGLEQGHRARRVVETPKSGRQVLLAGAVVGLFGGVQAIFFVKCLIRDTYGRYGALFQLANLVRKDGGGKGRGEEDGNQAPQHFLYFFPLPQGHGSLRPALDWAIFGFEAGEASPPTNCSAAISFSFLRWIFRVRSMTEFWAAWETATGSGAFSSSSSSDQISGCGTCSVAGASVRCMKNSQRMVSSSMRSIMSWNRTKDSFLYSTSGSFWP